MVSRDHKAWWRMDPLVQRFPPFELAQPPFQLKQSDPNFQVENLGRVVQFRLWMMGRFSHELKEAGVLPFLSCRLNTQVCPCYHKMEHSPLIASFHLDQMAYFYKGGASVILSS